MLFRSSNSEDEAKKRLESRLARRMSGLAAPAEEGEKNAEGSLNIRNDDK